LSAHPSSGGQSPISGDNDNNHSPNFHTHDSHNLSLHPSFTYPLQGIFKATVETEKIQYCTRGRLLDNSDHAYFAELLATHYININAAASYAHIYASIVESTTTCTFFSRGNSKFEENTISMWYIKGKNLAQNFPSSIQRTKKTNYSTIIGNNIVKYTYVCIPAIDNKWFEHRWKITCEKGGSYYLCVDVPGTGIKRKRTTKPSERNKTQRTVHEKDNQNNFTFNWTTSPSGSPSISPSISPPISPTFISPPTSSLSSPIISPTASSLSSPFSFSSPSQFVPQVSTSSVFPPFLIDSLSVFPPPADYLQPSLPLKDVHLNSVQDLNAFLASLCNNN